MRGETVLVTGGAAGDLHDTEAARNTFTRIDSIVPLPATVGVGRSMNAISRAAAADDSATAARPERIAARPARRPVAEPAARGLVT